MNRIDTLILSIPVAVGVLAAAGASSYTAAVGAAIQRTGPAANHPAPGASPSSALPQSSPASDALSAAAHTDADRLFVERMIAHHERCIAEIEARMPDIRDQSLKLAAAEMLDEHRREIELMRAPRNDGVRTASEHE